MRVISVRCGICTAPLGRRCLVSAPVPNQHRNTPRSLRPTVFSCPFQLVVFPATATPVPPDSGAVCLFILSSCFTRGAFFLLFLEFAFTLPCFFSFLVVFSVWPVLILLLILLSLKNACSCCSLYLYKNVLWKTVLSLVFGTRFRGTFRDSALCLT